ncbi:MAG: hypothetical protein OEZ06_28490 [Myxococcales bacterium]|nr:hypothetical protein [Myxococcales bacterium]
MFSRASSEPGRLERVFQIGFNRCGTKTLAEFFAAHGYRVAHWESGALAAGIELARRQGKPLLSHIDRYDVFTDMEKINISKLHQKRFPNRMLRRLRKVLDPERDRTPVYAYKYFDELDRQYPGSRFILNTRDVDGWIASRLRFHRTTPYRSCIHGDGVHASEQELGECWRADWIEHHRRVQEHFKDRPEALLILDIERDDPGRLVEFLPNYELKIAHWQRRNTTAPTR